MSDTGYVPKPAGRTGRGYRIRPARHGDHGELEREHELCAAVTLHYGAGGPRTLPAGTPVTVLERIADIVRFTYDGCTAEYAATHAENVRARA